MQQILMVMLGICSIEDVLEKQVSLLVVAMFSIVAIGMRVYENNWNTMEIIGGVAVGVFVYILALCTGEKVGKGDAVLLMGTGLYLDFWSNLILLWVASSAAGVYSLLLMLCRKKRKGYRFAFVPFLFGACLLLYWIQERGVL